MKLARIPILPVLLLASLATVSGAGAQVLSFGTGQNHTLAVAANSKVWSWGFNSGGQLGDGTTVNRPAPVEVSNLSGVVAVAGTQVASYALLANGTMRSFGSDTNGALGNGSGGNTTVPGTVSVVSNIVQIAGGGFHGLALRNDGRVFSWGLNSSGQLGHGATGPLQLPMLIASLTNVVYIAAGYNHSFAITASGALFAWGANGSGQLGINSLVNATTPVQVTALGGAVEAACGLNHSVFRNAAGQVFTCGEGSSGQLGLGNFVDQLVPVPIGGLTGATRVAAGSSFSLAMLSTGSLRSWGTNAVGQLGIGTTGGTHNTPQTINNVTQAVSIAAGTAHGAALKRDGRIQCWGQDANGELGNGTLPGGGLPGFIVPLRLYPGSSDDLQLATAVDSASLTSGAGNDFKVLDAGSFLTLRVRSQDADFFAAPYLIVAELYTTGFVPVPPPGFPEIHLSLGGAVILASGPNPGPIVQVLGLSGVILGFAIPPGFTGSSVLIQGVASSATAVNGIFAATEGHEIRIL